MAMPKSPAPTRTPDYLVLMTTGLLVILGLQAVWSATFGLSLAQYGDVNYYVARQGLWALIGGLIMAVLARLNYRRWRRWSIGVLGVAVAALAAIQVPGLGVSVYGATRSLNLGPLPPVQPSEFAKLALILYLSAWLSFRESRLRSLRGGVIPFVLLVSLVGGLVMLQPDMGTTLIIAVVAVTIFFLSGARLGHMALLGASSAGAFVLLATVAGYRQERLGSFFTFGQDPGGRDFHVMQALIALGSGGLTGLGPGASRQKFFYLPDSHTDSIFAVLGEELGLWGTAGVIILFGLLVWRCFRLARAASDDFGALLASSIGSWIAYQALINIGGITRSIPLTGITLPFISYGGSSLVVFMAAIGLILSISRHQTEGLEERAGAPVEAKPTQASLSRGLGRAGGGR